MIFVVSASGPSISLNHLPGLLAPGGNKFDIQRVFNATLRQSWRLGIYGSEKLAKTLLRKHPLPLAATGEGGKSQLALVEFLY